MKARKNIGRREFIKNSIFGALSGGVYLNSLNRTTVIKNFSGEEELNKKNNEEKIEYRKLGNIGYNASVVGFGAMLTNDASVLQRALDMGINYIDTARSYQRGNNEIMVGRVIKKRRKDVFLSTKNKQRSMRTIVKDAEESLKALDTDYVDCFLAHDVTSREQVINEDIMSALEKLKKEGKARYIGISTHSSEAEIIDAMINSKFYDLVTVKYNYRSDEKLIKAVERANKAGIAVVAMKVMGGKWWTYVIRWRRGYTGHKMEGLNPCQAALKWVINDKNIATTIPSITSFQQLDENFSIMGSKFSWSDRKTLDKFARMTDKLYCRMCGECSNVCPENVNIPDIMRFLMYADGYGELELGRNSYKSLSSNERASKCTGCNHCVVPCVNKLNIRERMLRAHSKLA